MSQHVSKNNTLFSILLNLEDKCEHIKKEKRFYRNDRQLQTVKNALSKCIGDQ